MEVVQGLLCSLRTVPMERVFPAANLAGVHCGPEYMYSGTSESLTVLVQYREHELDHPLIAVE